MDELTLYDAAIELGVKPSTLRQQIRNGRLASAGKDRRGDLLVTREEVERYRRENLGRHGNGDRSAAGRRLAEQMAAMTPDEKRARGQRAAAARWAGVPPEERSASGRRAAKARWNGGDRTHE